MALATKEDVILLSLSPIEAAALKAIMQRIGGNPDNTIRKYADNINDALINVGFKWQKSIACNKRNNSIYFEEGSIKDLDIS